PDSAAEFRLGISPINFSNARPSISLIPHASANSPPVTTNPPCAPCSETPHSIPAPRDPDLPLAPMLTLHQEALAILRQPQIHALVRTLTPNPETLNPWR